MTIDLPAIPAGILTLLAFFAPYAIAIINHPAWAPKWKRLVAIIVSIVLALVVMVLYYVMTGDLIPQWPVLLLLAVVVTQAAYALVLKPSAKSVETQLGAR